MSAKQPSSLAFRLRKTKAALLAVVLTLSGILLIMANGWAAGLELGSWSWLHALPLGELGGTLFGAGLLGTLFEYSFRKDQEEATAEQFREIIREQAPAMRDAVVEGFAIHPEDLKRVATPELLDQLAENSLAMRFGDRDFAREVYGDIRDQAIRASERWSDVRVDVALSIDRGRSIAPTQFIVTCRWEYTVIPRHATREFVCVSNRDEYAELARARGAMSAWYLNPQGGSDPASPDSFQVLDFTVEGRSVPIRRSSRKGGQTYRVSVPHEYLDKGEAVRVSYTYRTRTPAFGHLLHLDIEQPTHGLSMELDYTDTTIAGIDVLDLISGAEGTRVHRSPAAVPTRTIGVDYDGWVFPRAGVAFVWTMTQEQELERLSISEDPAQRPEQAKDPPHHSGADQYT